MDLQVEEVIYHNHGNQNIEDLRVTIPQIIASEYKERLKEIRETYEIIRDSHTGRAFEIAIVNRNQLKNGAVLMPSTMFSSLTQNRGNAIELAAHGAASPHTARIYVAFPGNGGSANLSRRDRRYLARTGRFTQDNMAMESVAALAHALEERNIPIQSISANAEAGRLGLGIMAALPADTVRSAYFNGLPGISPLYASYITIMMREDREGQRARTVEDRTEEYKVSERTMAEAKPYLSNLYHGCQHWRRFIWTYVRAVPNMAAYTKAFSQYDDMDAPQSHAVFQDMLIALRRQKQARMTLEFGELSELHSIMECKRYGQMVTQELGETSDQSRLQLYIHDGSLDFHTIYPSKRWAAEKAALALH